MEDTHTVKERLKLIADSNTSTEADEVFMDALMQVMAIPGKVTCGIVCIMPYGQMPPVDIHQFAGLVLKAMEKEGV